MRFHLDPGRTILGAFISRFRHRHPNEPVQAIDKMAKVSEKVSSVIDQSNYLSRDLSWLKFNERVLDQARSPERTLMERLKFLAISASNLDEFFMIRVGSLYNYLDYHKQRIDYSGLREVPFRKALFTTAQQFCREQQAVFTDQLLPLFAENELFLANYNDLTDREKTEATDFFDRTIYPTLTPMLYDYTHTFPVLLAKVLIFGVVTQNPDGTDLQSLRSEDEEERQRLSFVQIPANLPRFLSFERDDVMVFLPIEEVIRQHIKKLYRNVEILSVNLFRITRNGDFTLEENDDDEVDFIDEVRQKIKNRRLGRVTRIEVEGGCMESAVVKRPGAPWMINLLKKRWEIDDLNIFESSTLLDFSAFWQVIGHPEFKEDMPRPHVPVPPMGMSRASMSREKTDNIFDLIKQRDLLLHHPYNNFEPVLQLLEQAAEDPNVLAIKITVYRLAKRSRITEALLKAAENGKHVSVLFEVKARFDEENNIREAQRLQKAGCFVIYGISRFKTHTKLLLVVRNEGNRVVRYAHMATGNYNEDTSKLYTDIGLLTTNEVYTHDISEFFNVITGHSLPNEYKYLITAPRDMREQLIRLIRIEADNARKELPCGVCIKVNSLEDKAVIDELYKASQMGVPVRLIVRSICCLRPQRVGLSENINVRSVVGDFLEHTRIYYFHNNGDPKVYGGSADVMVRSFDRRIESLFYLADPRVKQLAILILDYNLRDNVNAYELNEDGSFKKCEVTAGSEPFNMHQRFFDVTEKAAMATRLFDPETKPAEVAEIEEEYQEGAERAIADI
ncbi:polyphosphate kinase 1 [Spirosoma montaniterrae]|uniref:Polyphosphate kinase n=1 Tax=Spirosoma montaniterrae TaxID=1178516 RepID=A0A1P9WS99_9BACT|nr:polyphosphate kinase 1 [Spirosoma montaniterrae]AQG78266.1 RNA degradosome polyphosphate kinase [Spirosoma montaniterrae]